MQAIEKMINNIPDRYHNLTGRIEERIIILILI